MDEPDRAKRTAGLWIVHRFEGRFRGPGEEAIPARRILEGMDFWTAALWTLLPTVLVSLIFFFVLRSIIRADRTERRVYAKVDAEERAKRGLPPRAAASSPSDS